MKRFIKEDLKKSLLQKEAGNAMTESAEMMDTARINLLLVDAEQNAKIRESIGPLDPHRNVTHGSKLKVFVKRVVRKLSWWMVRPIVDSQNYYNALNNSISNAVRDSVCILKDTVYEQQKEINELKQKLAELEKIQGRTLSLSAMSNTQKTDLSEGGELGKVIQEIEALKTEYAKIKEYVEVVEDEESIHDYIDYVDFEKKFRGSSKEVCSRIKRYLEYFEEDDTVVDLGCGRGEWLGLLEANGINAIGIDINPDFVSICKEKGLEIEEGNFFDYLESIPDASLDGITAIQVIEHLTPVELARLVKLCYKKLKFGGHVILETQNPMSVSAMTNNFYVDPTHERPVHPRWIEYLMEKAMFTDITIEFPEYAWVTEGSIPALEGNEKNIHDFNGKISYLNNLLYGSTDYAIIAVK